VRETKEGRMADLTIRVPSDLVDHVAEELLQRYASLTGTLHRATTAYAATRQGLDDLRGARVELFDVDDALEQLHWATGWPGPGPFELCAHPEVLADAVAGAAARAADRVTLRRLEALLRDVMGE
jgi:hypothetical protein